MVIQKIVVYIIDICGNIGNNCNTGNIGNSGSVGNSVIIDNCGIRGNTQNCLVLVLKYARIVVIQVIVVI